MTSPNTQAPAAERDNHGAPTERIVLTAAGYQAVMGAIDYLEDNTADGHGQDCANALIEMMRGYVPAEGAALASQPAQAETVGADGWPRLDKPATVGAGTFGVGVSSRLVVQAAQRAHEYKQEQPALTPEQAREAERSRRALWDLMNGSLDATPPQAQPAPVASMAAPVAYFSYGEDSGYVEHTTADGAIKQAKADLNAYRIDAMQDNEWPDAVESVCWGVVLQKTAAIDNSEAAGQPSFEYELSPAASAQQPAPVAVDEREAFEAEMRCAEVWGHRSLKKRLNGKYENWQVDLMWRVWQARSALQSAPSGQDGGDAGGEVVACPNCNGSGTVSVLSDASPDAYNVDVDCPHCKGTGALEDAYAGGEASQIVEDLDDLAFDLYYEGNCEMSQEKQSWSKLIERAARALEATLTTPKPAAVFAEGVPQGWKLVPVEPTAEMCAEGIDDEGYTIKDGKAFARALYACMLATAPVATVQGAGQAVGEDVALKVSRYEFLRQRGGGSWSINGGPGLATGELFDAAVDAALSANKEQQG